MGAPWRWLQQGFSVDASFGQKDIDDILSALAPDELDALPFGVIKVDQKGTILIYNAAEASLAGLDPKAVVGLNFFRDIAPCTASSAFLGRFVEGVREGKLDATFEYLFAFPGRPTLVTIRLRRSYHDPNIWIFVSPKSTDPSTTSE
jgi:photoactive yellow protein